MVETFAWTRDRDKGSQYVLLSLLLYIGYFIPLLIFPVGAYYYRHSLYSPTSSTMFRIGVLMLFTSCSVLFYKLSQAGFSFIRTLPSARYQTFAKLVHEAKKAPIEIATQAHLLEESREGGLIELTIQIRNVPLTLSSYHLAIFQREQAFIFSAVNGVQFHKSHNTIDLLYIINNNGTWNFYQERCLHELKSNGLATPVTFIVEFEFERRDTRQIQEYPTLLTPRLTMRAYDYKVFQRDEIFFEKTIPISYSDSVQSGFFFRQTLPTPRGQTFTKLLSEAKKAPIEIEVLQAHLLEEDCEGGIFELTIQIRNVPLSLRCYHLTISETEQAFTFSEVTGMEYYRDLNKLDLYVMNNNGTWSFNKWVVRHQKRKLYELKSNGPANSVTIVIEFDRRSARQIGEYPTSITPRLNLKAYDYAVFQEDEIFFEKTIPISLS